MAAGKGKNASATRKKAVRRVRGGDALRAPLEASPEIFAVIKKMHSKKLIASTEAAWLAFTQLENYLEYQKLYKGGANFDTAWLRSLLETKFFPGQAKTQHLRRALGQFVAGLVHYGSSVNMAEKAVSEWRACSETSVRTSYRDYKAVKANGGILYKDWSLVRWLLIDTKKPFPVAYPKAKVAFDKMLAALPR